MKYRFTLFLACIYILYYGVWLPSILFSFYPRVPRINKIQKKTQIVYKRKKNHAGTANNRIYTRICG